MASNEHHRLGEVGRDAAAARILADSFQEHLSTLASDIQQLAIWRELQQFDRSPPPANILPAGHQVIDEVILRG